MAVKKTAKKAAKKTYPPTKKSVPTLKKMSIEELAAVMAENHAKTEAAFREHSAIIAKSREETEKAMAKSREETDKAIRETAAVVRELNNTVGGQGRHIGELVELLVVPKIRLAMNNLGKHTFDKAIADKVVTAVVDGKKTFIAQMDMLLYNDTEAMAVEIKTNLQTTDVEEHLRRLQKLRDHEDEAGVTGKKLFGAVAGAIVNSWARDLALKNGLYVVEIREEEDKLDIEKPEPCRTW